MKYLELIGYRFTDQAKEEYNINMEPREGDNEQRKAKSVR